MTPPGGPLAHGAGHRRHGLVAHLVLAAVVYVPLLAVNSPGKVAADTKTYLYLDPGRLLARAPSMWDPSIGFGTVTHQNIGYLFPMGPYYWLMEQAGLPDWVAQRLWLGSLLFAAGAGVLFLLRTWGLRGAPALVAALAYALSPYLLDYAARISVILMPWSALPWLVALCVRALRRGGWLHPALFALVVLLVGGVNATALLLVGVAPALWFPYAVWVLREVRLRSALGCVARIGVLTTAVSLWWMAGLRTQGSYGIDILAFTETYEAVAKTSSAPEVLRGLGYWFFYGSDKLGPWIEPGRQYAEQLWLVVVTFALPALAFAAALTTRWRHRAYAASLVVVGVVLAVGGHPLHAPTPVGRLLEAVISSGPGMALRSTPRAVPLVVLGCALFLAYGLEAVRRAVPRRAAVASAGVGVLVLAAMPPLFTGDIYGTSLQRAEDIPGYWREAATALDAQPHHTRVLELPGSDFASYRWGNTVDPVTPGLMDRPYVARELIPYGSPASAALLNAFDRRMQEGWFEPGTVVPFARLVSAGTVVLRNDLQFERYRTPRPRQLWAAVHGLPGLSQARGFGPGDPNIPIPRLPLRDESELNQPAGLPHPPEVGAFDVADAPPIVRAVPAGDATVLVGDADGVVDLAAAGLLRPDRLLLLAAGATDAQVAEAAARGAHVVLTDTNRRQARRWGTVRENLGAVEQAGEEPLEHDPSDNRLPVFPGQSDHDMTVAEHRGVAGVRATAYGNPVSYTAEDRAVHALDGDVRTAWRVGAFADVTGERLRVDLAAPTTAAHVQLLQPVTGPRNRWITRARLWFDGADPVVVVLDETSRAEPGQRLTFPARTFRRLDVEILDTTLGLRPRYDGISGVGIAELWVPGPTGADVRVDEVLRLPTAVPAVGDANRLTVLLTRERANPSEPVRSDPEAAMARSITLPTARTFTVSGTARLSPAASDATVDLVTGTAGDAVFTSTVRMPGSVANRAAAAFDGDPTTAWRTSFGFVEGATVEARLPAPVTVERLDLRLLADGRHSVPTALDVVADGGAPVRVEVPPIGDGAAEGHVVDISVVLPAPVTGSVLAVTVAAIRAVETTDYYGEQPITMPVGIAELGLPGVATARPLDAAPAPDCRDDLVRVGDRPVPVRLLPGPAGTLRVEGCAPVALGAGVHDVRTAVGADLGVDVDRLVLDAAPVAAAPPAPPAPPVTVLDEGRTAWRLRVGATAEPTWLVLGQSLSAGWTATVVGSDDGAGSLGAPTLVQGYANGWLLAAGPEREVTLTWTPQRVVWVALASSVLGTLVCLAVVAVGLLRDRRGRGAPAWARGGADEATARLVEASEPSTRPAWATVTVAAVLAGLAGGPLSAAVVAGAGVVMRRAPRRRWVVALVPAGLLVTVVAYMAALQVRFRLPAGFEWPTYFLATGPVAWAAVCLLGAMVAWETIADGTVRDAPAPAAVNSPVDDEDQRSQGSPSSSAQP